MTSLLWKAHSYLLVAGGVYVLFLGALVLEPVQRSLIYLNQIKFPWGDLSDTERFGFAPGKVLPFELETHDGAHLGVWHVLPEDVYQNAMLQSGGVPSAGPFPQSVYDEALLSPDHRTMLFFHGNAASRAAPYRVQMAREMSRQNVNFVVIDYRGFGDSSTVPVPTEAGLLIDARRAWDYLIAKGVTADRIGVVGHSLGSGVASGLLSSLSEEGTSPHSLTLISAFSSLPTLLQTFKLFNFIPILGPFKPIPGAIEMFLNALYTKFDSKAVIKNIHCPILLLHAKNDLTIPFSHSVDLVSHLLSPLVPLSTRHPQASFSFPAPEAISESRAGQWGIVKTYARELRTQGSVELRTVRVVFGQAERGGHNSLMTGEVAIGLIAGFLNDGLVASEG